MFYYVPTKVYEEINCVKNHGSELASLGTKALIVTGHHSARINGALDDVTRALHKEGKDYYLFDEVEENPSVETVARAARKALRAGADFVIGIGGGSPMDASKAIALMMKNPDKGTEILYDASFSDDAVPVVTIPTTCGTGSEVTAISVLTRHEMQTKQSIPHRIFPVMSLVDGKYLKAAPRKVLCDTAVDALAHMWESYLCTKATDYSRMFVKEGLSIWSKTLPVLRGEREATAEDYRNLMNAATLGGMAIAHTGTSIPHALSYTITYETGMKHGAAVGRFQAGYMAMADEKVRDEMLTMAGFGSLPEFEEFFRLVCGCDEIPEEILKKTIELVSEQKARLELAPYPVDKEVLEKIARWM